MDGMLFFGSIFRYKENTYVYLGSSGDVTYAAKIIDAKLTSVLRDRQDKLSAKKTNNSVEDMPLYAFVVLKTPNYEDCAAHFGEPNVAQGSFEFLGSLVDEDIANLRKEINESRCASANLKQVVNS
jgi:hypothetical protein